MATISTSGIASGSIIRAEQVLRIIEALDGTDKNDIIVSGSVDITGSFGIRSGSITNSASAPFMLAYNTGSGAVTFTQRNSTSGTSGTSGTVGTSGTSGTSGTVGTSGTSGSSGTSGTSGSSGSSGTNGTSGAAGGDGDKYKTTSSTNETIALGSQTFVVETGLSWTTGQTAIVTDASNDANYMAGEVTAYNSANGNLTVNVTVVGGSGTKSSWVVNLSGEVGAAGSSGTSGTSGTTPFPFSGSADISGSLTVTGSNAPAVRVSGSTTLTGSLFTSGSNILSGSFLQSGSTQITGSTLLSGSLLLTGSSALALRVTGSTALTGSLNVSGSVSASNVYSIGDAYLGTGGGSDEVKLIHAGDADTYLLYDANVVNLVAGGSSAIKLDLSTNKISLNNTNSNLDTQINADDGEVVLHVDAGDNRVGINKTTPNNDLDIEGGTSITGSASISGSLSVLNKVAASLNVSSSNLFIPALSVTGSTTLTGSLLHSGSTLLSGTLKIHSSSGMVQDNDLPAILSYNTSSGLVSYTTGSLGGGGGGSGFPHTGSAAVSGTLNSTGSGVNAADFSGSLVVTGAAFVTSLTETSALRFKENIENMNGELDNVYKLRPVDFDWKENGEGDKGLIAEEVNLIYPEFVTLNTDGTMQGIKYSKLISVLIKSVQELKDEVDSLKSQING